jgi:hypothetical protein
MTRDKKYIFYLVALMVLLVSIFLFRTSQYDWSVTYAHEDKNPFGTYAFSQLLTPYFSDGSVVNSKKTLYELKDSIGFDKNLLIIATRFSPDKEDTKVLLSLVESGANAFISADRFGGVFADTLGIQIADSFFKGESAFQPGDSAAIHLVNNSFDTVQQYLFRRGNITNFISSVDSVKATVIARNDYFQPVTIRIELGKGILLLNSTPMMFTNIYLLNNKNHELVGNTLSFLKNKNLYRTEYYHLGRMEVSTPLRFILTTEPLRWAYYVTIISLLFFMVFEAKRKQRIIPVIKPLANSTLEFVSTIGNLYYQRGDHKNIADKKIQFFFEYIHSHYRIPVIQRDDNFINILVKKTGMEPVTCRQLVLLINHITGSEKISKDELITLNALLDKFQFKM